MTQHLEELDIGSGATQTSLRIEPSPRRVRAFVNGTAIADSRHVLLVFEPRRLPVYYFPSADVRMDLLEPSAYSSGAGGQSTLTRWNLDFDGRVVDNVGWTHRDTDGERTALKDHVAFYWAKLDAWFEEDEEVFVHPRDPHKRVDVLASSRHVRVEVDGQVVADTHHPSLLFETDLPTRYYIPRLDVRLELLEPTQTTTQCPYKGRAVYWSIRTGEHVHKDLVWSYPFPIAECPKIERLMAFYNEKLDIYVDDELQPRPRTMWS